MSAAIPPFERRIPLAYTANPPIAGRFILAEAQQLGRLLPENIERQAEADHEPIPPASLREGYGGDSDSLYWTSGLIDFLMLEAKIPDRKASVLDFGCATARVLRNFARDGYHAQGVDLNINNALWCLKHLHKLVVSISTPNPSLPYQDSTFDFIYALSVFTHIDLEELPWLLEFKRILKPGRLIYITIHGDSAWENRRSNGLADGVLAGSPDYDPLLTGPIPFGRASFSHPGGIKMFGNSFHSHQYVPEIWGRFFDVVNLVQGEHFYQDGVLLGKLTNVQMAARKISEIHSRGSERFSGYRFGLHELIPRNISGLMPFGGRSTRVDDAVASFPA